MLKSKFLVCQNVTLLRNRVIADVVRMRSYSSITGVLRKRRHSYVGADTQGEGPVKMAAGFGVMDLEDHVMPETANERSARDLGQILPHSPQHRPTLLTPSLSWTSSLQNCEAVHFWYLKPPSLWYFVRTALGS